jgi:hypothetical protein
VLDQCPATHSVGRMLSRQRRAGAAPFGLRHFPAAPIRSGASRRRLSQRAAKRPLSLPSRASGGGTGRRSGRGGWLISPCSLPRRSQPPSATQPDRPRCNQVRAASPRPMATVLQGAPGRRVAQALRPIAATHPARHSCEGSRALGSDRRQFLFTSKGQPRCSQSVDVAWRQAGTFRLLPARLQQALLAQAYEQRIKCA